MSIMHFAAVLMSATLLLPTFASAATCSSDTDLFVHRIITIPQKPLNPILLQRYQAPSLDIRCLSVDEAGPSGVSATLCPTTTPQLCTRLASDTLGPLTCETLSDFASDPNTKISRGDANGPDRVWVVRWDPSSRSVTCFPRTIEVRILAFARGEHQSSTTLAVLAAIVAFAAVLLIVLAIVYFCRLRCLQLDRAGATTIGGPKMNYRGMQMHAAEPEANRSNVTRVVLPVKQSGAIEDLNSKYEDAIRTSPRGTLIIDESGDVSRGPNMIAQPRRASPPQPGDGIHDPELASKIQSARRRGMMGRRRGPMGINGVEEDDDGYGPDAFGRGPAMLSLDDPNGGEIVYDDYGTPIGRRPPRRRGQSRGRRNTESQLFPTQDGWSTMDESGTAKSRGFVDPYGEDFNDENGPIEYDENGQPIRRRSMRAPQGLNDPNATYVKFQPQWMHGSFGRGGVIPEFGEADPTDNINNSSFGRGPSTVQGGTVNAGMRPAQRYRNNPPPPTQQQSQGQQAPGTRTMNGNTPRVPESPLHAGLGGQTPRSILKSGKRRPQVGGASPMDELEEPMPYSGRPSIDRSTPRDSMGPSERQPLGDSRVNPNVYQDPARKGDSFQRGGAKMHDKSVPLDATAYEPSTLGPNGRPTNGRPPRGGAPSVSGGINGNDGRRGSAGGGEWVCQDCGENVGGPSGNVFCVATGKKHL